MEIEEENESIDIGRHKGGPADQERQTDISTMLLIKSGFEKNQSHLQSLRQRKQQRYTQQKQQSSQVESEVQKREMSEMNVATDPDSQD